MRDYLAMVGDAVDNVPGSPAWAIKRRKNFSGNTGLWKNIYSSLSELSPALKGQLSGTPG
jgi:5'-3' exonuclease